MLGPVLLLLGEKRTERSTVYGLMLEIYSQGTVLVSAIKITLRAEGFFLQCASAVTITAEDHNSWLAWLVAVNCLILIKQCPGLLNRNLSQPKS